MKVSPTAIPDVLLVDLEHFDDHRGRFVRHWDAAVWESHGIGPFVQDNVSVSGPGVLRGLHFQIKNPQGKLVSVMAGRIYDVVVDIRRSSETYGQWVGVELCADTPRQLWVPPGLAHGFCVCDGPATVHYRCTTVYESDHQGGIRWDCPDLGIDWPLESPVLSDRDQGWGPLSGH
jgi:dTDP-4-dehydrorhamnose 3,5-epimerase